MKIEYPITQGFGANANPSYIAGGLKGHTGIDYDGGYGAPVHAIWGNEYVYKVLDETHLANDGSGFTGVFTIVDNSTECFEFLYGHGDPLVAVGQTLSQGSVVMTEANHGEVYSGGVHITLDMQKSGDKRGAHVHAQKRPLRKDTSMQPNTTYLTAPGGGVLTLNGFFYAIPNYGNGYNGCVDWSVEVKDTPFITMQKAILAFQLSEGLIDFRQSPLTEVVFGTKTKRAANKYMTNNKYN